MEFKLFSDICLLETASLCSFLLDSALESDFSLRDTFSRTGSLYCQNQAKMSKYPESSTTVSTDLRKQTNKVCMYIYIYTYVCVCVCSCKSTPWPWERGLGSFLWFSVSLHTLYFQLTSTFNSQLQLTSCTGVVCSTLSLKARNWVDLPPSPHLPHTRFRQPVKRTTNTPYWRNKVLTWDRDESRSMWGRERKTCNTARTLRGKL